MRLGTQGVRARLANLAALARYLAIFAINFSLNLRPINLAEPWLVLVGSAL